MSLWYIAPNGFPISRAARVAHVVVINPRPLRRGLLEGNECRRRVRMNRL